MSFSGLKTAVRTHALSTDRCSDADIAASFQAAVVDVLLDRVRRAVDETGLTQVALSGGVSANGELRRRIAEMEGIEAFVPPRSRCTDNASMIANAGRLHLLAGQRDGPGLGARSSWQLGPE